MLRVADGRGVVVGVGWGINKGWFSVRLSHAAGKLFSVTILCTDTPKKAAMPRQVSPSWTRYVMGVGLGSGVNVNVGGN